MTMNIAISSITDFMKLAKCLFTSSSIVVAPVGVPAVFHGIDQQIGHESIHIGRPPHVDCRTAAAVRRLHRAHVVFAVINDG